MASFEIVSPKHGTFTVLVDADDLERVLNAGPWSIKAAQKSGQTPYVRRHLTLGFKRYSKQHLHNFILGVPRVDHLNGNGLDNRRENLRPASHAENCQNQKLRSDNTSGHRGVSWHKQRRAWQAYTNIEGRRKGLGWFKNIEEALEAVKSARAKHMPFANEMRTT